MGLLKRCLRALWTALAVLILSATAEGQLSREYDVKAAFLYNFTSFVEWPETAFKSPEDPFVIGIFGEDPFGKVLDDIVAGEQVKGRPLVVRRINRLEDAKNCQILFVSSSQRRSARDILICCQNASVLTVADIPDFIEAGGTIAFRIEENRLKLHINVGAARASGLTVSSKLLKLSKITGDASP
jgi:hypothetical protein